MPLDVVKPLVDAFQYQQQVRGGTGSRTGGIQHQVAHRAVQLLAVLRNPLHAPQADTDNQRVMQFHPVPFHHFRIVVVQQVLVVANPVAHGVVGGIHVQRGSQGLVQDVNHIESPCVLIQVHVQFLVINRRRTAVFMQQLVAQFQRGTCQQQAALLLVVVDVGFHRNDVEIPLRRHLHRKHCHHHQDGHTDMSG